MTTKETKDKNKVFLHMFGSGTEINIFHESNVFFLPGRRLIKEEVPIIPSHFLSGKYINNKQYNNIPNEEDVKCRKQPYCRSLFRRNVETGNRRKLGRSCV